MTTQINIPNRNIKTFIECCDKLQIIYHQIEARECDTRYEIVTGSAATCFYLGSAYGLEIGYAINTETLDQLQNGN
jgi:hypothetical protein